MAEWSNAHDSKSCDAGTYPRVQIPFSAPRKKTDLFRLFCCKVRGRKSCVFKGSREERITNKKNKRRKLMSDDTLL